MNWSAAYNQSLVRRGEIILGFDVVDNWDTELKEMNKDKVGQPFHYPEIFFFYLVMMPRHIFIFHIGKQSRYCTRGHAKGKVPSIPHYSTISRRINRLNIEINDNKNWKYEDEYIVIAVDSNGIKVTNRGLGG